MNNAIAISPALKSELALELGITCTVEVSSMRLACYDASFAIGSDVISGTFQRNAQIDRWELVSDLSPWLAEQSEDQIGRCEGAVNRVLRAFDKKLCG